MEAPQCSAPGRLTLRDVLDAVTATNQETALLDYGNVLIRRGYNQLKTVGLLSGGIAGADLIHAGFVGKGMLTAVILGETVVPSSRQILHTIKEMNEGTKNGIFVIVQGNSDVFNFKLAVQRANQDCRTRVKLLLIDDDKSEVKERYSCGFILLAKILGALAEEGALFDDVSKFYESVVHNIITLSLNFLLEGHNITISEDFEMMFKQTVDFPQGTAPPIVALINTSRNMDRFLELGLVKRIIDKFQGVQVPVVRLYYGNFVTTAPQTATVTVMKEVDTKILQCLDAATEAPGWKHVTQFLPQITTFNQIPGILHQQGKQPCVLKGPRLSQYQTFILEKSVQFACDALISCERQLNIIDSERSAGNVGTRFRKLSEGLNKKLANHKLPTDCPYAFFKKLAIIAEAGLGGTLGSIYGILFDNAANVFGELPDVEYVTPFLWARAFTYAVNSMKDYFQVDGDKNVFYPLKSCEMAINKEISKDQQFLQCYGLGVSVAEEAAQKTKLENEHPDAGAHAVGIWMRASFEAVKLTSANAMCENEL